MASSTVQAEVKDKVALVTGAASGIGLAITKCLLNEGAKVMLADINEAEGQKSLSSLSNEFPLDNISFTKVDVSVREQLADVFVKTKERFGGLDIVCNNAGIADENNWKKMVEVNLFSVVEGVALAIEHMSTAKGGKGGVVINTSSLAGLTPGTISFAKYAATKFAVVGYTRVHKPIAKSDGIRVNCICPGLVDTTPAREMLANPPPEFVPPIVEYMKTHLLSTERVAEGVLELIKDTTKAGDVMAISFEKGFTYPDLPENSSFP